MTLAVSVVPDPADSPVTSTVIVALKVREGQVTAVSSTRTPRHVTPHILRLIRNLGLDGEPERIPVRPVPEASAGECFPNVSRHVERAGGAVVYGWALWEWPNILVEAEFHSVWLNEGILRDITPNSETEILFQRDAKRVHTGAQVRNARLALRDDQVIRDLISLCDAHYRILNRGQRRIERKFRIPRHEIEPVMTWLDRLTEWLRAGKTDQSLCDCGSGRPYRECCTTQVALIIADAAS